jgi:superfamily II DNA or RNA helicase
LRVVECVGGKAVPSAPFDILVATPDAFLQTQVPACAEELCLGSFVLVVFDEVHHTTGGHPYRLIAKALQKLRVDKKCPNVLGLTASLTYATKETKIKRDVDALCMDLNIATLWKCSNDELEKMGLHQFYRRFPKRFYQSRG